jgi:mono/diheme cytochrome c family protein
MRRLGPRSTQAGHWQQRPLNYAPCALVSLAMNTLKALILFASTANFATASDADPEPRWYKPSHAEAGRGLFETHCASCHGIGAAGDPNWREPDVNGLNRPPPLNGTAHAWHHPLAVLYEQIVRGSASGVGNMPAFNDVLARGEVLAIIAYFQSLWPEEIYRAWQRMDKTARNKGSVR